MIERSHCMFFVFFGLFIADWQVIVFSCASLRSATTLHNILFTKSVPAEMVAVKLEDMG
jgi:hypothetical protein